MQERVGACETDIYMCNVSAAWGSSHTALSVLPSLDAKGSGPGCLEGRIRGGLWVAFSQPHSGLREQQSHMSKGSTLIG